MDIQWYPGHMTKTRRQIQADLKLVDLVAEIIDARIPISSRNPDIDELVGEKPRLIVLNRADQADPAMNKVWGDWFRSRGWWVLETNARDGKGVSQFSTAIRSAMTPKRAFTATAVRPAMAACCSAGLCRRSGRQTPCRSLWKPWSSGKTISPPAKSASSRCSSPWPKTEGTTSCGAWS